MKKTSIIVHQNYIEGVIKKLHELGLMEIIDISKEEPDIFQDTEKPVLAPEEKTCEDYITRLSKIVDILKKVSKKKSVIKAFLKPELPETKTIQDRSLKDIFSNAESVLTEIEAQILERDKKNVEIKEQISVIKKDMDQLNYLKYSDLDISDIGESEYLIVKAGKTDNLEKIKNQIKNLEKVTLFSKQFGTGKKTEWSVILVSHITEKNNIEKICRENLTEFDFEVTSGKPENLVKSLENKIKSINKEKKKIISFLQSSAKKHLIELLSLREEIQLEKIRLEVPKNFTKTASTYVVSGWIIEEDKDKIEKSLTEVAKNHITFDFKTPSINPDRPPTYIKTPRWAEGFKSLVSMFATPRYNEINPTVIMGIFFILFFGIMLGDAGYGLILLILSLFGYLKIGKHSNLIRDWSFMGIWMGLVTTIVGFLTYSIFGNFVHTMLMGDSSGFLYSFTFLNINFPIDSLKEPLVILIAALVLGLVHLNIGIVLSIIQSAKQKHYKEMITEHFCWVPLQLGGGMLIGQFILGMKISSSLFNIAIVLVIVGLLLLFIAKGPVGFFSITGYVGDWLSYSRLLALGLATAGMALAFNEVSMLLGDMIPFIGIIITVVLLVVLHLVNLGISALGAGVHSLRLQYVEFFNRFYEGGGHEFSPFKIKRKYTKKLEEE